MKKRALIPALIVGFSAVLSVSLSNTWAEPAAPAHPAPAAMPDIPGITTADPKPHACVDCHKNYPGQFDARLSVALKSWASKTDPKILAKAQATMPAGVKLEGKHPDVSALVKVIPNDCLMCHGGTTSQRVPPFRKMLHMIHLTGGKDNHFIAMFGGKCTLCHKLDQNTGTWSFAGGGMEEK